VNKRLLLVDDEETILFALERYFTRLGFIVDQARELEEAEALAAFTAYDLVIADLSLSAEGTTEGLEIVRHVRRYCRNARTIILTGNATPVIEREAYRRGADVLLRKPRPLAEIANVVASLLGEVA
jgi:ActR/RegA family two-component response regulator